MHSRFRLAASGALVAATFIVSALAQNAPVRVRGAVTAMEGATITVKGRDGDATIKLADNWTVGGRGPATVGDIKAGGFVGVAAVPQAGGGLRAVEVFVFPPGQKGGEGHYAWDLLPEGTMTNATVAETVQGMSGQNLRLTYQGGEKTILVPADAVITTSAPAEKTEVKPGAIVFLSAQKQPDGSLTAARVTVNKAGVPAP